MGKRMDAWKKLIFEKLLKKPDKTEEKDKEKNEEKETEEIREEKAGEKAEDEIEKEEQKKETENKAEKDEKEKEAEDEAEKDEKEKEVENEAEKDEKEKEAENEAEKDEKEKEAENEAEKDEKEKEAENEAEKDKKEEKEKDENAKEAEKEDGKENAVEKEKDDKQQLREGRKLKKDLDALKEDTKEKNSGKEHGRAADQAERSMAGEVLKHMLEYEQLHETPKNRVLTELVSSGKTDELVRVISATDKFQASHKNTEQKDDAKQKDPSALHAENAPKMQQPEPAIQTAQYLTEALQMAREHEKERKREEEKKERLGYKELLAMEDAAHGRKSVEKRIIKRPVKELKLADSAEAGKTQNIEPPAMGPKLPSRRKKPNQDPNQQ